MHGRRLSNLVVWFLVRCLTLAEGARHAVVDGFDEVLEERPFRRLDINLRRHAGRRLEVWDGDGGCVEFDADNIDVGWAHLLRLLLVCQRVRRKIDHVSGNHRRDPLAQRGKPYRRLLAALDAVDILRSQPRLDDQFVLERQELHDVLAGFHDTALGVIAQLHHDATDRCGNADPIEHAFGAEHPLANISQFAAYLVKLIHGRLDRGLAYTVDLFDRAGDALLGVTDIAHDPADLALQIGLGTLQHHQFGLAHQSCLHQAILGLDFLIEQDDLPFHGTELNPRSLDTLLERLDALVNALDVA